MRRILVFVGMLLPLSSLVACQAVSSRQAQWLVLTHVNSIDVTGGTVRRDYTVTMRDGRITAVEPSRRVSVPAQALVIDATGKYLIPGLADMHVHWYDERFLSLFVANGVTTVRQMWGMPLHQEWRKRIDGGELLGPRFAIASPVVDGPNPVWPGSMVVDDARNGREAVANIKRDGYDFVKVYNRLPREAYLSIASEARARGIPVAGHVPLAVSASEASDAGQKSIEHMTGILLAASSAENQLRQQSLRTLKGGEANEGIDRNSRGSLREINERLLATYDPAKATALFSRFAKNGTWQCPTLTVLRSMASLDDPRFTADVRLKYMPRQVRESWNPKNDPRLASKTPEDYALDRRILQKEMEIVSSMKQAGVKFLAGTDVLNPFAFPGFSLHDELALLVEGGLTPIQALQAATVNPATYLGTDASAGTIEKGKLADLVLLDANPLDDIRNTKEIAAVVIRGRFIGRAELEGMLMKAEKMANLPSIGSALSVTIENEGIAAALEQYRDLKARQGNAYDFSEGELNDLGYTLMRAKKTTAAVEILKLNVEAYSNSANAYQMTEHCSAPAPSGEGARNMTITIQKQ